MPCLNLVVPFTCLEDILKYCLNNNTVVPLIFRPPGHSLFSTKCHIAGIVAMLDVSNVNNIHVTCKEAASVP